MSRNPVIMSVTHHRQNPLEFIFTSLLLNKLKLEIIDTILLRKDLEIYSPVKEKFHASI
jgi:hypothetical protein